MHKSGLVGDQVRVDQLGGQLIIDSSGGDAALQMTGPANTVFEGKLTHDKIG
jgi:diaminopimelate epimerase